MRAKSAMLPNPPTRTKATFCGLVALTWGGRDRRSGTPRRIEPSPGSQLPVPWLFIRTIGIARATTKIGMANLVYNIKRFIFLRKIAFA
jgi:hypothetical protein